MEIDSGNRGEGFRSYYIQKIEELQLIVNEKSQNLRRLQAQRNELNAKGMKHDFPILLFIMTVHCHLFQFVCYVRNFNCFKNKEVMLEKL